MDEGEMDEGEGEDDEEAPATAAPGDTAVGLFGRRRARAQSPRAPATPARLLLRRLCAPASSTRDSTRLFATRLLDSTFGLDLSWLDFGLDPTSPHLPPLTLPPVASRNLAVMLLTALWALREFGTSVVLPSHSLLQRQAVRLLCSSAFVASRHSAADSTSSSSLPDRAVSWWPEGLPQPPPLHAQAFLLDAEGSLSPEPLVIRLPPLAMLSLHHLRALVKSMDAAPIDAAVSCAHVLLAALHRHLTNLASSPPSSPPSAPLRSAVSAIWLCLCDLLGTLQSASPPASQPFASPVGPMSDAWAGFLDLLTRTLRCACRPPSMAAPPPACRVLYIVPLYLSAHTARHLYLCPTRHSEPLYLYLTPHSGRARSLSLRATPHRLFPPQRALAAP